ncbi:MAG: hypothetical protein DRO88_09770 [Promethearchaeia archaeon]|nr:MAG: hypothetical protein DRO88_09770 [Candidatus Lokiarchaeia archaeon]
MAKKTNTSTSKKHSEPSRRKSRAKSEVKSISGAPQEVIRQGSVAEFFRKRTQLVGFDFGLNKHTQYCIEFLDNSLDAIESFYWKESKRHPEYTFKLKDDLLLQNFSYLAGGVSEKDLQDLEERLNSERVDDAGYSLTEDGTLAILPEEHKEDEELIIEEELPKTDESSPEDDEEAKKLRMLQKKDEERAQEVQNILEGIKNFIFPIQVLVEREPFVIIQLTEREAQDVFADASQTKKEVLEYDFEIFDNGTGMSPTDLEKFGKYLASSKSQKLRQTRGSQGFGSPSAFSDAQNTTGKPVTVVSKDINHIYGIASQFYTTSKNNKEYVVTPTEIDCPFEHGTYIRLQYINVKYRKGYIDSYIQMTALTNPHITIIFLDPYGGETIYPRRVSRFPREPTYALPHPSSVNIGDFQDLLRTSNKLSLSVFLQDNFVRLSSSMAKDILFNAEFELEKQLNLLNLDHGVITWAHNELEKIYFIRKEKRIFGRAKKPREKWVVYSIEKSEDLKQYWDIILPFNKILDDIKRKNKEIKKLNKKISTLSVKKEISSIKKEISTLEKGIAANLKEINRQKKKLSQIVKIFSLNADSEVSDVKITDKLEENVKELLISQARPNSLTQKQTEALFKAFKAQKFMKPPSDPAVPIGASVLETTLIKEYNLNPAFRTDLFHDIEYIIEPLTQKESQNFSYRILYKFLQEPYLNPNFSTKDLLLDDREHELEEYRTLFLKFDALYNIEEDFIYAHTRPPTSGKGLAFVVEAGIALSPKIPQAKTAQQVLLRYVNRTPKMRDNSDCAIWKGCQMVNWKNYKLDTFDNGIPKGSIRILVNVSGPYVHLMFKSQSKNALAEDEILLKEIKYCLETIGRKIRNYQNRKIRRENRRKRSKVIEKYIPIFVSSLVNIIKNTDLEQVPDRKELESQIYMRLEGKLEVPEEKPESSEKGTENFEKIKEKINKQKKALEKEKEPTITKEKAPNSELKRESSISVKPRSILKKENTSQSDVKHIPSHAPKSVEKVDDIIKKWKKGAEHPKSAKKIIKVKDSDIIKKKTIKKNTPKVRKSTQSKLTPRKAFTSKISAPKVTTQTKSSEPPKKLTKPSSKIRIITTDTILKTLENQNWVNIKDLIKLLDIKDVKDARYLQLKLKQLTREKKVLLTIQSGRTYWKLNKAEVNL